MSRNARPRQLYLKQPRAGPEAAVDEHQTSSIIKWLQGRLSAQLLGDLQHVGMQGIGRHPNDCREKPMAYAIPMCVGCTEVISLRIRDCAGLEMAWLPATVTHLQLEGDISIVDQNLSKVTSFNHCHTLYAPRHDSKTLSTLVLSQGTTVQSGVPIAIDEELCECFPCSTRNPVCLFRRGSLSRAKLC